MGLSGDTTDDLQAQIVELQRRVQELEEENERVLRDTVDHFRSRSAFRNLLARISSRFVHIGIDEVDAAIEQALADIGGFVRCDRSFLCQYTVDGSRMNNTHDWCAPGVESLRPYFQSFATQGYEWLTEAQARGETVGIERAEELPEPADKLRTLLEHIGVRSLVMVPLLSESRLRGFVGFSFNDRPHEWHEEQIELLRIVGETFLGAIDRRTYERKVRRNEEQFRILAENVPGVVYLCRNDDRYSVIFLNDQIETLTGYSSGEFLADQVSFVELFHPDDAANIVAEVNAALSEGRQFYIEYRMRHRDGSWRWVEERGQGVFEANGKLRFLEGTIFDISRRKQAEDRLRAAHDELESRVIDRTRQLQTANDQLRHEVNVRRAAEQALRNEQDLLLDTLQQHDNDRKLVAYEIHDGLAQYLTASIMHLSAFSHATREHNKENSQLELVRQLLRRSIDEARRLISGLRPPILDDAGVVSALQYLVNERGPEIGELTFTHKVQFQRLPPLLESAIYRVTQEALTNVVRHSGAQRARVELYQRDNKVIVTVKDWGRGFEPSQVTEHRYGLRGVRERAVILGGQALVKSEPGKGTEITVLFPLPDRPTPAAEGSAE